MRARSVAAALGLLTSGLVLAVAPPGWAAAWTDAAATGPTAASAAVVPAPTNLRCTSLLGGVRFLWDAVPGATSYTLSSGSNGQSATTVTGTRADVGGSGNGVASVRANIAYGATTWTSASSATRSYTIFIFGSC